MPTYTNAARLCGRGRLRSPRPLASVRPRGPDAPPSGPFADLNGGPSPEGGEDGGGTLAIYHLRASVISRSQGRSATAAIAYRAAERITDRRTGLVFDYAAKAGVEHTEILAPNHAPDWVHDRSELWNRVEEAETRRNSQVAREVRVALPSELTHAERVELVRGFVREQFVERGMVADVAIHAPGRDGDERNHHAHILLTTRELGAPGEDDAPIEGFGKKARDWNKVEVLEAWREGWARDSNAALERAGREDRVDHRTLAAQREAALERAVEARERGDAREELAETVRAVELDRPPLPQLSPGAWQMKARGIEVGRVGAWYEAKQRAAEVREIAADLGRQVRDWIGEHLDRTAERVRERVRPALGRTGADRGLDGADSAGREGGDRDDVNARLRRALEGWRRSDDERGQRHGVSAERQDREVAEPEREAAPEDLAARLRAALGRIDPARLAEGAASLRESREAEEHEAAREKAERAREAERVRELEKVREREAQEKDRERSRDRDSGWDYGL